MDKKEFTSEELHEIARKIVVDIKEKTGGNIKITQLVLGMCDNNQN